MLSLEEAMAQTLTHDFPGASAGAAARAEVPWHIWAGVVAVSSIMFGLYWDISWHQTIGRDTFWTPAHLAIHFGGILAAITCTYLIFSTTFGHDAEAKATSVGVWGFRGPLGAFLTAWGGVTMLTSAPFDNWWHNSFGLDVEILSPPHVVLGVGIMGVGIGSLLLLVSAMNRAQGITKQRLNAMFLYTSGILLVLHMIIVSEYSDGSFMHSSIFYKIHAFGVPVLLVGFGRGSGRRWGATIVASIYMAIFLLGLWIFPFFPATPKLGPVFTNVTHMVPMGFPVLLIFPAILMDIVLNRTSGRNAWFQALLLGTVFVAGLLAVQWPFGDFMISTHARNAVFGQNYFPYAFPPSLYKLVWEFQLDASPGVFWKGMGIAWALAVASSRIGVAFGERLSRLRR
jgi:hypothetical protein